MKWILPIIVLICFSATAQPVRPDVFLSQIEMTRSGGGNLNEMWALNTSGASLTKTGVSFPATGTYRVDISGYTLNQIPIIRIAVDAVTVNMTIDSLSPKIYSVLTPSIAAGIHTVTITLTNYSAMAAVGLIYFTQSSNPQPYRYPVITAVALIPNQFITARQFGSGHLRGFNNETTLNRHDSEFTLLRATRANITRIWLRVDTIVGTSDYTFQTGALTKLDRQIDLADSLGFYIMIALEVMPEGTSENFWGTTARCIALKAGIATVWKTLATRYKDRTSVSGYDLINEPRGLGNYNFNYAEVIRFEQQLIDSIRTIDTNHVVAFEVEKNDMLNMMLPLPDTNAVYSPHGYSPLEITHQGVIGTVINDYPHLTSTSNLTAPWTKTDLSKQHGGPRTISRYFHVPIWYGEFSCVSWSPLNSSGEWTSTRWIDDNISLVEAEGFSWVYHSWRGPREWDAEIPSQWYATNATFTNARPNSFPPTSARTGTAPTIVMLKKWFMFNDTAQFVAQQVPQDPNDFYFGLQ